MYVKYQGIDYPCKSQITNRSIMYSDLPDVFPEIVEGEIILYYDSGLVRRKDNTKNYLRVVRSRNVLTLTNIPESIEHEQPDDPVIPIEPTLSLEDRVATLEAELEESKARNAELEAQLTDTQLALCEVYEATLGG